MINDAIFYQPYEIIGGEKIMSPSAGAYHNNVMGGLYIRLGIYVRTHQTATFLRIVLTYICLTEIFLIPIYL